MGEPEPPPPVCHRTGRCPGWVEPELLWGQPGPPVLLACGGPLGPAVWSQGTCHPCPWASVHLQPGPPQQAEARTGRGQCGAELSPEVSSRKWVP